jgi:hypothetical protein
MPRPVLRVSLAAALAATVTACASPAADPHAAPTPTPTTAPAALAGRIVFLSDEGAAPGIAAIAPDGAAEPTWSSGQVCSPPRSPATAPGSR